MIRIKGFTDLKYNPGRDDLVTEYRVEPAERHSFKKVAEHIAGESSIGTWTGILTMNRRIIKNLKPNIYYMNRKESIIKIAYPKHLFEEGNMPQILSSVAGNVFGMKSVRNLRLEDISFPKKIVKSFRGPLFGIKGVRRFLGIRKRPLVGTIVKPKLGLKASEHAKDAYKCWIGGCDIVKDDENLSSMKFNKFKERIVKTLRMRDRAEKETGEKKVYMPNVTAETKEMVKRARFVKKNHGRYVMIDIITSGWSSLQTLRDERLGLVIHAHRAGHAAITHGKHGISMLTIGKIARLIGVDQLHIGTAYVGKMRGGIKEVKEIEEEIEGEEVDEDNVRHVLRQRWYGIKPVFAVASGGLYPGAVPKLIERMGKDIIIQAGGGIHGHKGGVVKGATAMRQAVDAVMKGKDIKDCPEKELKQAIKQWGVS